MKTRPIIFNDEMVRAILDRRKTQTRRAIKPMRGIQSEWLTPSGINSVKSGRLINGGWQMYHPRAGTFYMGVNAADDSPYGWIRCPYGQPGDLLWVRETWYVIGQSAGEWCKVGYVADDSSSGLIPLINPITRPFGRSTGANRPSIFMPRWASRITLRVMDVRVERVQDISLYDAIQEGYPGYAFPVPEKKRRCALISREFNVLLPKVRKWFVDLWDSINAKRGYGWDINPWVWVVKFEVVK